MHTDDPVQIPGKVKISLVACFGGLLAILIALGIYAAHALDRGRAAAAESTRQYLVHREALSSLRTAVYSTSSYLRDYLLDPTESHDALHAEAARTEWSKARSNYQSYRDVTAAGPATEQLEREMARYWATAEQGLRLSGTARAGAGYRWLSDEIGPARERLLQAVESLVQSDNVMLKSKIAETASILDGLQSRLWIAIGLSLLFSSILAAVTYRYLSRLETHAAVRYRQSLEAAAQMEQLSRRLLDVQESERKKLARELHDEVGQCLGALLVDLGQARSAVHQSETAPRIQSALELGERALRSVRDISLLLRPSMLDDLGLIPALNWQAREINRRTGMTIAVRSEDDELDLSEELRTTIYRVVQEALNNAARHSSAKTAEVGITRRDGQWRILVRDDGTGFDASRTVGLGLLGMQERVARLKGKLWIASIPGGGTTLTVELPAAPVEESETAVAG